MRLARLLVFGLVVVFVGHCAYFYPLLPETLASHFDGRGNPNGWMTKDFFFVFEGVLLGFVVLLSLLMPKIIEKSPRKWVNLPNKDYWLTDGRRQETIETIGLYQEWFCVALMALFIAVNHLVFEANIAKQPLPSGPMWTILLVFFAFVAVWLVLFYKKFRMPE